MTRAFSPAEKRALWEGWKVGLSLVEIGRGLDRQAGTILNVVRREGGFAPRPHKRSATALKAVERVTVMHDGRVLKHGTPGEIESDPEVQSIYMGRKH